MPMSVHLQAPRLLTTVAILLVSGHALAVVDGERHQLWKKHTVQGGSVIIGNTLLASTNAGVINDIPLSPAETFATLTGLPQDATLAGAYVFWSGSLRPGDQADRFVDMAFPDGTIQPNIPVDRCRTLARLPGGVSSAYACRADVTALARAHMARQPDGTRTPNGSYNLLNVYAAPGTPVGQSGVCSDPNDPCQSAFGGWAVVLVWSSPAASTTKEVMVYDGFLRLDEICEPSFRPGETCLDGGSSGISAPITLGGFNAIERSAEFSFLAFEGDRQLGSPPEPAQNADFMRFNGVELSNNALGVLPKNLFNSVIFNRQGGTPFSGVDIKTLPVTLPPPTGFPPTTKQVDVQPGSGDGIPDLGPYFDSEGFISNGELFYLSALTLTVDALAPNFRNSRKTVDKTSAAPNEVLTYNIHVENNGSYLTDTTSFKDVLPPSLVYVPGSFKVDGVTRPDGGTNPLQNGFSLGQLWPIGVPGNKNYVDLSFQARVRADFEGGVVCNVGEIQATYTPPGAGSIALPAVPVKTNPCTTVQLPRIGQPTKTVLVEGQSTRDAKPGSRLRYTINVSNSGAQAAVGLVLNDDLPRFLTNLRLVSVPHGATDRSSSTGGAYGAGVVRLENLTVPPQYSVSVIFDADVLDAQAFIDAGGRDGQSIPNQARLSGPGVDPSRALSDDPMSPLPGDPTTVFVRFGVDLSTSAKTVTGDTNGEIVPGQDVVYTVRVANTGAQGGTAIVDDALPPGLTDCEVISGPIGGCANGRLQGQFPIAAGESIDLKVRARVNSSAQDGQVITNVATIRAAERPNVVWEVRAPSLRVRSRVVWSLTKTVTDLNGGSPEPGDELAYTLVLKNVGNRESGAVVVRDPLDPNLTFLTADQGGTFAAGEVRWSSSTTPGLVRVAPNAEVRLSFRARINSVPNGTVIPNQARVESPEANAVSDDPTTSAPNDPTLVRVTAAPSFVDSTKTVRDVNGGVVQPGDVLEYTIVVRNTGRVAGTRIVVTDVVDENLTVETIEGGGTLAGRTITWDVGTVEPGAELPPLVFTARVKTPLPHGTLISNQARIQAAETPGWAPTDDPATPVKGDPTTVRVSSAVTLGASTKTVRVQNGGLPLPGETLVWTIRVQATGDAPASNVTVLDSIERCLVDVVPTRGGVFDGSRIRWDRTTTPALEQVLPAAPVELSFTARIAPNAPDGTRCQNQATVLSPSTPAPSLTDDPSTPAPNDPTVIVVVSKPVLSASTKRVELIDDVERNGRYNPGDRIRYTLDVRNTGSEPALDVRVDDLLSPLLEDITLSSGGTYSGGNARWALGTLPPRSNRELVVEATIRRPLDHGTLIANQGTITASNLADPVLTDDPSTPEPNDPTHFIVESAPRFVFEKTALDLNGGRVEPGDVIRYTVSIRNTGTSVARGVRLNDPLDLNLAFVSATGAGSFDSATRTLTWSIGELGLDETQTVSFDARIAQALDNGTPVDNQAFAVSDETPAPTPSDDPSTPTPNDPTRLVVISAADLSSSTKTFTDRNGGDARPGELIDWTITLRNTGNAVARNIAVEDALDPSLEVEGALGAGGTVSGRTLRWTLPQPLGVGESMSLTYTTRIRLPLTDGTLVSNQASIRIADAATPFLTDDPTTPAPSDPTSFVVRSAPDVRLTKTVTDLNGGNVRPGDELGYRLRLTNVGDADATGGTLADVLDPNVDFVSATGDYVFDPTNRVVRWNVPRVGVTPEELTLTLVTRVRRPLANGTIVSNQASLTVAELGMPLLSDDPTTPAPNDPTNVTVVSTPDFSRSAKTVVDLNGGDFAPRDQVEFTILVRNTGDVQATNVSVTDVVDERFTNVEPLDGGHFDANTRTVSWALANVGLSPVGDRPLRFRARIAPLLSNGTRLENQAFITSAETPTPVPTDDPSTPAPADPTALVVVSRPQLQTSTKTVVDVDGGLVRPGDLLRYDITVRNVGDTYATDVLVTDALDGLLQDVAPDQGGVLGGALLRWDRTTTPALARIEPGSDVTLSFTARIRPDTPSGSVISNQALIQSAEGVEARTDDPTTDAIGDPTLIEVKFPDLARTTKTVVDTNGGDVEPGDELVWSIVIRNDGTLPATNVVVSDPVDTAHLVDLVADQGGRLTNGVLVWDKTTTPALSEIAPGATLSVSFRSRVRALTRNGTLIENQARIDAAELLSPVQTDADLATPEREKTQVSVVARPRLEASTLSVQSANPDEVRPGETLSYTLTVRNDGNTQAHAVSVRVPLDRNLVDVAQVTPGRREGGVLAWTANELPRLAEVRPGDEVKIEFTGRIRAPIANATLISLQGELMADELDALARTDDPATPVFGDPTVVTVFSAPRFTKSEKTVRNLSGGTVEPGDELEYEIVLLNDGTESGFNVRLHDVVPPGTSYAPGSLTLNGRAVADGGVFPLTNGLSVQSARDGTAPGELLVDDGLFPDDEAAVVTYRVVVSRQAVPGTVIRNQGKVTSAQTTPQFTDDPSTPIKGDATVVVVGGGPSIDGARLSWRLTEDLGVPGEVNPGDLVEVLVEVPNAGDQSISCLVSELPLDARLGPEGDLDLNGAQVTATADDDAGEWLEEGSARAVVRLGEIAPGGVSRIVARARVRAETSGVVSLQAKIRCGSVLERLTDADPSLPGAQPATFRIVGEGEPSGPVLRGSLKTVEDLNGGEVEAGDLLRYRITLVNDGDADALDVTVTDILPSQLLYVPDSILGDAGLAVSGDLEEELSVVTARARRLGAGQRLSFTFLARLKSGLPVGRTVENIASVRAIGVESFKLPPASVTIGGIAGTASVVGRVWEDLDMDGRYDASNDEAYAGFHVHLLSRAANPDGEPASVKSTISRAGGDYALVNLPPGQYLLDVRSPDGATWKRITVHALQANETRLVDAQLTPTGIVYAAKDGSAVQNARVFVHYDESMLGVAPPACDEDQNPIALVSHAQTGRELPRRVGAACLLPGQQGQLVAPNGGYRLDRTEHDGTFAYLIDVAPASSALAFPSVAVPPEKGLAPSGSIGPTRPQGGKATWYSRLALQADEPDTTYNHLPVDALQDQVRIVKTASRGSARVGEFVTYTVAVTNDSTRDLTVGETGGVDVVDLFPENLRYVRGSARAFRRTALGDRCARLDASTTEVGCDEGSVEPAGVGDGSGRLARFGKYDLKTGETLVVRYTLAVTPRAKPGDHDNIAYAQTAGIRITNDAIATVRVLWDALFNESTVIGKVFCDDDGDSIQTPGEAGLGLARIYADNGYYAEADYDGKFHFVGLKPGLHLFKLDERSLPPGVSVETGEVRKTLYLTSGLDTRLNFRVSCDLDEARPTDVRLIEAPPPPPPPSVIVQGSSLPFELLLDGVAARAGETRIELVLDSPDATRRANLSLAPANALSSPLRFRVQSAAGPTPTRWRLVIRDEDDKARYETMGTGAPPTVISWTGPRDGEAPLRAGARYLYALETEAPGGVHFTSAPRAFGVEWNDPSSEESLPLPPTPLKTELTGALFGVRDAVPGKALIEQLARFVSELPERNARVSVEVHADQAEGVQAERLTSERAQLIAELLTAQGVAPQNIDAVGRGASDPVADSSSKVPGKQRAQAQALNRRVVLTATPPLPDALPDAVPQPTEKPAQAFVDDEPVPFGDDGRFRTHVPRPKSGTFVVRVVSPSGAELAARWGAGPRVAALGTPPFDVTVTPRTGDVVVGNAEFVLPFLASDVSLEQSGLVALSDTGPTEPVRFVADVRGVVARWRLPVHDPDGRLVNQLAGEGAPPAVIVWDGRSQTGAALLREGSYTYQFFASDAAGNRVETSRKAMIAYRTPPALEETLEQGAAFGHARQTTLTPDGKRQLEALAKRLRATDLPIVVHGHVDTDDDADIASQRAAVVQEALVRLGISPERVRAEGRGATEPIAPNVTARTRERNRRVVVSTVFVPPALSETPESISISVAGEALSAGPNGTFTTRLSVRPPEPLSVELTGNRGRRVKYRVDMPTPDVHEDRAGTSKAPRSGRAYAQAGEGPLELSEFDDFPLLPDDLLLPPASVPSDAPSSGPVRTPPPERQGDRIIVARRAEEAPPELIALKLVATLPKDGSTLRSRRFLVQGTTDTRNTLRVNGEKLPVDERTSRFARVIDLSEGENTITLETTDPDGNTATLSRTYTVDSKSLFVLALADANAGTFGGEPEGIDSLALRLGARRNAFIGGRLAATVSGETTPPKFFGSFFKSLRLTANVDTARRNDDAAFRDLYDPTRYYPVFGDASSLVQEAPARGPVFARIDADDSHLLFGEFRTSLGASELLRYDRTLYGGELLFKREWTPSIRTSVSGVGAPGDDRVRHGHAELRATGGSVYYLPGGNVVEGTERVRLVVRDRDTGVELSSAERARHADYLVSYVDGRLLFKQPVSSTAEPVFLVNHNLSTAMNGHPVFVVVDYEYRDVRGDQGGVVGGHVTQSFFDGLLSVGGGVLQESRASLSPYRLWGVELGSKKSERTYAKVEFARSRGTDSNSFFSADGGLSYAPLAARCLAENDVGCTDATGNALKFEAAGELAELLGRERELAQARLYLQKFDTGFFTTGALLEQGTLKYGAQVKVPLTPKDALLVRHDSVESVVDRDVTAPGLQPKTITRRLSGLQYRHTEKTWGAVAEYANAITTDTSLPADARSIVGDTLLVGGNWKPLEDLNLTLSQEGILRGDERLLRSWTDHLTTSVGAQYKLSEHLTATLTESVRWSGENATQLGLSTKLSDTAHLYVNERFTSRAGEHVSTTLVGGSAELAAGLRTYGEWQLDGAMSGAQNRAVLGLNQTWRPLEGLTLSAGYERTQVVGDAVAPLTDGGALGASPGATQGSILGTPPFASPGLNPALAIMPGTASRDVASIGFEWTRHSFLKASARLEGRYDDADPEFAKTTEGVADRLQFVFLSTVDWKWTDDVAFIARIVYADAFVQDPSHSLLEMREKSALDARYLEAIGGVALRPKNYDWLALLARGGRVIDRRPLDVALRLYDEQQSDVVALAPSFETPFNVGLSFKLAYKHVRSIVTGVPESTSHVVLNVNRVDYHVLPQLDLTAEYRFMWTRLASAGALPDAQSFVPQGDFEHGAVFEAAWRPTPYTRLGAGYSFARFSDNELARADDFRGGFFVRVTGQY